MFAVKSQAQQEDMLALHRVRSRKVRIDNPMVRLIAETMRA
jgi:hypothetical protein